MALGGSAPRRYAEALHELAVDAGAVQRYRGSMNDLRGSFDRSALRLLGAPNVPLARRMAAAERALDGHPDDVRALVQLLVQRGRAELIPQIAQAFDELVDRVEGVQRARITTAVELDEAQRRDTVARLERGLGAKLRPTFEIDPTLIGGARVQVGDHLVDGSVKAQLEALRAQLVS